MSVPAVAAIVDSRGSQRFEEDLSAAGASFDSPAFEPELAEYLRGDPGLVDRWQGLSWDQRSMPAAYVEGTEAGWFDGAFRDVVHHPDTAAAVADFVKRSARRRRDLSE